MGREEYEVEKDESEEVDTEELLAALRGDISIKTTTE